LWSAYSAVLLHSWKKETIESSLINARSKIVKGETKVRIKLQEKKNLFDSPVKWRENQNKKNLNILSNCYRACVAPLRYFWHLDTHKYTHTPRIYVDIIVFCKKCFFGGKIKMSWWAMLNPHERCQTKRWIMWWKKDGGALTLKHLFSDCPRHLHFLNENEIFSASF
jgi:hypothetical protein